ncbi:toll-like receptor Tollo isoform X2 [Parasteatoda tepidariorum]|uniref:toll-like receptor Tollo isoform X2 n=1 Tax=Parasteatoda tepidariorum TaxID=114398 RepID=UPI001C71AE38|nr:toll-like receptor Tollo isoform X2 [Parasteatoda tepidariorum]
MKYLMMAHCQIRDFNMSHYKNLLHLQGLDLRYNKIEVIPNRRIAFRLLGHLLLDGNLIREIKASKTHLATLNLFNNRLLSLGTVLRFGQVRYVHVAKNEIQQLTAWDFKGLKELFELEAQKNQIKMIERLTFAGNRNELIILDLSHNHLRTLNGSFQYLSELRELYLASNFISVFEKGEFLGLKSLYYLDINGNRIVTVGNCLRHLSQLKSLYLSNNSIETLRKEQMPDPLEYVDLSVNPFRCDCEFLPFIQWVFANPKAPHVFGGRKICVPEFPSDNHHCPSQCDCYCANDDEEYFMAVDCSSKNISIIPQFLTAYSVEIKNVNQTLCGNVGESGEYLLKGKAIWTLDETDICQTFIELYFSVAFGFIAFFLIITVLKIVHTRYKMNINAWLYAHGVIWVKEKDIDRDKIFDAFLSFSHKDQELVVTDIISVIEVKQPMTRLCLHYKHFKAGDFIDQNIFNAVQNSKRTVIMLSKNFLESEWCIYEFRAAHLQALKDKINRVIIIKLGELPDDLHPDIKMSLENTTYLTWGEKYFWDKLFYVLPTSGQRLSKTTKVKADNYLMLHELK